MVIYPNPYNIKDDLNISFILTQRCKTIKVKIWTGGFRLIRAISYLQYNPGNNIISIDNSRLRNLSNGAYFLTVEAVNYNNEKISAKPQTLVVLK